MGIREGKFVDLGMPSSGKKAFLWTTENSAMSGSRASQEHEQRPWVDMVDRSGHLYWMIRIPASQHLRRMGATATSVSCVESVSGVGPSHTLRMGSTPSSGYGTQQVEPTRARLSFTRFDLRVISSTIWFSYLVNLVRQKIAAPWNDWLFALLLH